MKKLLFLFLLGILPLNFIVGNAGCYSTQNNNVYLVHNQRTIILKGKKENKEMKVRLTISIVFMVLLMIVSMHHMFFMWLHVALSDTIFLILYKLYNMVRI